MRDLPEDPAPEETPDLIRESTPVAKPMPGDIPVPNEVDK